MLPSPLPAALAGLFALTLALPAVASTAYATRGSCAGHPRIALKVPTGWCVGLVATAQDGLQKPRRLLEVAPGRF